MTDDIRGKKREESGFYSAYAGFAKILRSWLIGYGIGAPVILLAREWAFTKLTQHECVETVALLFGIGVGLQLIAAVVYKTAMWWLYIGELDPEFRKKRRHKLSDWLSEQYWIEGLFDLISIGMYVWGTITVLSVLCAKTAQTPCG